VAPTARRHPSLRRAAHALLPTLLLVPVVACSDDEEATPTTTTQTTTTPATTTQTTTTPTTTTPAEPLPTLVLNGQGNDLAVYDAETGEGRILIENAADDPENGRDVNGQICFFPDDPNRFIAGEDTGQPEVQAGWGVFELTGDTFDTLGARQVGKLTPTYQEGPQPENYGCGFLADGRLLTTDIGFQADGPENGQLILWFPPFEGDVTSYCKIDVGVGTALGITVVDDDVALVASSRGATAGVQRYEGAWPTGPTAAEGCGRTDATGAPLVDEGRVERTTFVTPGDGVIAAAAVARTPSGTFLVSSSITGVINEYTAEGDYVRSILAPPPGTPVTDAPYDTGTPQGIGVAPDGTVFYADLGIVFTSDRIGPGNRTGGVWRIRPEGDGYGRPERLDEGLAFPDGIGIRPGG
jgi:hypothetical protein